MSALDGSSAQQAGIAGSLDERLISDPSLMGWTAPRAASSVPRWSSFESAIWKGGRPWASLSLIPRLSRASGLIWPRGSSAFTRSTRPARSSRSVNRRTLLKFFDALPRCVVAMEACSSAHHWGRQLLELGFAVRLIPPAHVKPYVRRNKNDAADAAAICEAAGRPGQRFVPVRSVENQAALMRHRARELMVGQRTAAPNPLRGHRRCRRAGGAERLRAQGAGRRRRR
jgi:Transposase